MSKRIRYPIDLKIKIAKEYLEGRSSLKTLEKKYHINHADIQKWKDVYIEHGEDGLTTTNGTYSGDFKVSVVEYMKNTGASQRKTAAHFNIPSYTSVGQWERIYNEKGKEALYLESRGRESKMRTKKNKEKDETLLEEVKRLRMENEYLKKLNALVQEREESKKKTK